VTKHPRNDSLESLKIGHAIALSIAILCWILNHFSIVNHDFPSLFAIVACIISYLAIHVCKSTILCKNIFCLLLFIPIFLSSLNTGGIYSIDFIGLIAIPITAIILMNNKWGAFWTFIIVLAGIYSFRLEYLATESYLNQLERFDLSYFMTASIFFLVVTVGLVMLMKHQIFKKQEALELKDSRLSDMSEKLERSRKHQEDLFMRANHDIKQPLRNIKSFAQLLSKNLKNEPNLSKENLEFLNYIIEGSKELSSTVDELAQTEI